MSCPLKGTIGFLSAFSSLDNSHSCSLALTFNVLAFSALKCYKYCFGYNNRKLRDKLFSGTWKQVGLTLRDLLFDLLIPPPPELSEITFRPLNAHFQFCLVVWPAYQFKHPFQPILPHYHIYCIAVMSVSDFPSLLWSSLLFSNETCLGIVTLLTSALTGSSTLPVSSVFCFVLRPLFLLQWQAVLLLAVWTLPSQASWCQCHIKCEVM